MSEDGKNLLCERVGGFGRVQVVKNVQSVQTMNGLWEKVT